MTWLTIAAFDNPSDADAAKDSLGDIPSDVMAATGANYGLKSSYTGSWSGTFRTDTWLLQVLPEDAEKAAKIIDETWPDDFKARVIKPEAPEKPLCPCPQCGSHDVEPPNISTLYLFFSIILLGIPLLFYSARYKCRNCGYSFKELAG